MNKEFIPYKEALALKELGFDEPCFRYYNTEINKTLFINSGDIPAPLYQQAFRWFREKHNLLFYIYQQSNDTYRGVAQIDNKSQVNHVSEDFKTYEEAELECLKKLIELLNSKVDKTGT